MLLSKIEKYLTFQTIVNSKDCLKALEKQPTYFLDMNQGIAMYNILANLHVYCCVLAVISRVN